MSSAELETQHLARSCNELLILALLSHGTRHGYQLALELEEQSGRYFRFNHGTLYPILHKLEKGGLIRGRWHPDGPGRKRKSYTITPRGSKHLSRQREAWRTFFRHFSGIVGVVDQ